MRLEAGVRRKVGVIIKSQYDESCGGEFTNLTQVTNTGTHTQMNASNTGEV